MNKDFAISPSSYKPSYDNSSDAGPQSLSEKVVRGGLWVFGLRGLARGMGFVRTIVLARLLSPSDFGLFGVALLAISMTETFSQTGFQAALVQKKDNIQRYLDTAWTVSLLRGVLLFIILFVTAPLVAEFFKSPQASSVIRVIAIMTLVSGLRNIGIIFFQKELEFNKQFYYEFASNIVDLAVAVILAFILRNVWALVWSGLSAQLVRVLMSYYLHPYRPRFMIRKRQFKELFEYGKWILGSSILVFLITRGDDIIVGKLIGISGLGYYQMAYLISNAPATEISHLVSQVTFPAYAKMQDNLQRLKDAYLNVLQVVAFLIFPLAGSIILFARDFTEMCLGEPWVPIVYALQMLTLAGLVRSISATFGSVFQATGQPKIITKWQPIRLIVLLVLMCPLTLKFGIFGTSVAVFFSNLASSIGFGVQAARFMKTKVKVLLTRLISPFINTIISASIASLVKVFVPEFGPMELLAAVGINISIYLLLTYFFNRTSFSILSQKDRFAHS
jgi:O-antigen/teichoic acid export membrane protein